MFVWVRGTAYRRSFSVKIIAEVAPNGLLRSLVA